MKIYLASQSPRRQQLLKQIGVDFEIIDLEIDERWHDHELPNHYVQRMALEKVQAARKIVTDKNAILLAADTSVVIDNQVLGKALSKNDAVMMLQKLSGRKHIVYTAVAISTETTEKVLLNTNHVSFKVLSEQEITNYARSGEPVDKAGGYAIQGKAAIFVERLEGSFSGVMGLPLSETAMLLSEAGVII